MDFFAKLVNIIISLITPFFVIGSCMFFFYLFYELIYKKIIIEAFKIFWSEPEMDIFSSCGTLIFLIWAAYSGFFGKLFDEIKNIFI